MSALFVTPLGLAAACTPPPSGTEPSTTLPAPVDDPPVEGPDTVLLPNDWGAERFDPDVAELSYDLDGSYPARVADLYLPVGGGNRGVIVHVHGGGFVEGSRHDLERYSGPLLRQLERGFAILTIDYRFEAFPAAVWDLDAAVRFVRSEAGAQLGIRADTVLVSGHSAGGTIAADLALAGDRGDTAPFGQLSSVDGWLVVSALSDLDASYRGEPPAVHGWGAASEPDASPLRHLGPEDPPGLVVHGAEDGIVYVEHAEAFRTRALELGLGPDQLHVEVVTDGPQECRNHLPMCALAVSLLDTFVDRVSARGGTPPV